jgi:hypothetical protein
MTVWLAAMVCALLCAAPTASAETVVPPEEQVTVELRRPGGHVVYLVAKPLLGVAILQIQKGEPEVLRGRWSGAAFATRTSVGSAEDGLDASFGPAGEAVGSLEISRDGKPEPESGFAGCHGPAPRYFDATFDGDLALRVAGFGSFRVGHAEALVYRTYELHCTKGNGRRRGSDKRPDLFSYLTRPTHLLRGSDGLFLNSFTRHRNRVDELSVVLGQGGVRYRADRLERLPGDIAGVRWIEAAGLGKGSFQTGPGDPPSTATLEAPAPFTGTARYSHKHHSLLGDLAVTLPGNRRVHFGSRQSHAALCDFQLRRDPCR